MTNKPYKKIKITVLTPKNQAEKAMKKQRDALLGFKKQKKILEEKLVSHNKFYWIIPVDDEKDLVKITTRLSKGEIKIKQFYRTLIKLLDRANKLASKFKKGLSWVRRWIVKKLKKDKQTDYAKQINQMDNQELKNFIKIDDREEIIELMKKELITIKEL